MAENIFCVALIGVREMNIMSNGNDKSADKLMGRVKFYSRTKGYGFILRPDATDVFVHARDLPAGCDELLKDQYVAYILEDHDKGPRARDVELASPQ